MFFIIAFGNSYILWEKSLILTFIHIIYNQAYISDIYTNLIHLPIKV